MVTDVMTGIRTEARALADECLEHFWDGSVPVDPVRIAQRLGVKVMKVDLPPNTAGAVYKRKGDDAVILVDEDDHRNRQRFTVAHEIGHYARKVANGEEEIDFMDLRDEMASQGTNVEEIFANEFAASLLMPEQHLRKLSKRLQQNGVPNVLLLASRFHVSEDAMRYRLNRPDHYAGR